MFFNELTFFQKLKVGYIFFLEKKRAKNLDLSDIKARGMTNNDFINQQLEYIALFSSLTRILNKEKAIKIMCRVMENTAIDAFSKSSPEEEAISEFNDAFEFFRAYMAPLPNSCMKAGCLDMKLVENNENCFQFDIHWCVWLELAIKMGIPEACIPNCYADDYAYPDYFMKYGIKYSNKSTLAKGASCCDLRFERMK